MLYTKTFSSFPRQKLPISEKTDEWRRNCVDAGLRLVQQDNSRRSSKKTKQRNYNLYNGIFDKSDLEYEVQPITGKEYSFPAQMQYRDIVSPIFNLLFGEEYKRGTNFIVRGTDDDTHSTKTKLKKDSVLAMLETQLNGGSEENTTPEEIEKYYTYSYEDLRESIASKVLRYLNRSLSLENEFNVAWEDVLLAGEEIYNIDIISNEPVTKRENPLEIDYLLAPNSFIMDDAELIVKKTFYPPSRIIDEFYEDLTSAQIDELDSEKKDNVLNINPTFDLPQKQYIKTEEEIVSLGDNSFLDSDGNIRVATVIWKSRKKMGFRTYLDEVGEQQEDIVSEQFKKDKNNPDESIKWVWINEYWEGTLIGKDIYINMGPRKNQFRRMDNISACKSGFVGTIYNANNSRSVSLMDRLVPWIYLYITLWYRTELLIAANQGKIALIDVSLIPDGWEMDKWLYYATIMKFGFVNSFNVGKKGEAAGKLAGSSTQNKSLDLETGNAIQGHIGLLGYVEERLSDLSGVTKQRKGSISEREAVGNVERTIVQSSNMTEKWFQIHNSTKQRVYETLIEVAKKAWSGKSKKFQYVTDDMATVFFELDGNEFVNSEFNVFVTDASKDQMALQSLKQLMQVALQSDKVEFSDVIAPYLNDSIADIRNQLKKSEQERSAALSEGAKRTEQLELEKIQAEREFKTDELDRIDANKELDRISKEKIAFAQIKSDMDREQISNAGTTKIVKK